MNKTKKSIEVLVGTALLAALTIMLQFFVVIPLGAFTVTLTLVPIMLGAILYGPTAGAILGGFFGAVVCWQVVTGAAGVMSTQMLQTAPIITPVVCMLKGILAGFGAGWVRKLTKSVKHNTVSVILSAVTCPLINTGIFVAALFLFYQDILIEYAGNNTFSAMIAFVFMAILANAAIELLVNVLLVPVVVRLLKIVKIG